MSVVSLLKGSSSSKLAGELQGIVKSEPGVMTAKAESFGRALDSARRIVEDSQPSKSLKTKDKKKLSGNAEVAPNDSEKLGEKTAKVAKEANAETHPAGKKESSKAGPSKADSASFEAKAVAPEPTNAHKVAESVKSTLERLAAKSTALKEAKAPTESNKSQKSTKSEKEANALEAPEVTVKTQKGDEAVADSKNAKVAKSASPAFERAANVQSSNAASSPVVDADVKGAAKAQSATALQNSVEAIGNKGAGALLEPSRVEAVRTTDTVGGESTKVSTASVQAASAAVQGSAGMVQETAKKDARGTSTESKNSKPVATSTLSGAVKASAEEVETKDERVAPGTEESPGATVQGDASKDVEVSDSVSDEPVQVSDPVEKERTGDVESQVLGPDLGPVVKSSVGMPSGLTAASAASDFQESTNPTSAETQKATSPTKDAAVKTTAEDRKPKVAPDINTVKVSDGQMEAKASEHLYRAVNKLANGESSGVIAKAKKQPESRTKSESKKEARPVEGKTQAKDTVKSSDAPLKTVTSSVKLPLEETKVGIEQSKKQPAKVETAPAEPRMAKAPAKAAVVPEPMHARGQDQAKAEAKSKAEPVTRDVKAGDQRNAGAKEGARTQSAPNPELGRSMGLGARDSMTVEKSLIGDRLFGKRVAEKQPTTHRNTKASPEKAVAQQEATAGQRARAAKQATVAGPITQKAQQAVATDTATVAATSARPETVLPEMSAMKKPSTAAATVAADGGLKNEHSDAEATKNENANQGREQEQGNKHAKQRGQDNRHFEAKKQVEAETRLKEEVLDDLQEASDVEVAEEVAQVNQTVAANKVAVKSGGRAAINPLRDVGDTPSNAAAISERREVHEQLLAKNLGRNLGRIASMGTTRAKLRLHPQEFGRVDVEIRTRDGEVTLLVRTETVSAAAELNSQMNELRASMKEHGLHLAECEVDSRGFGAEGRGADGSQEGRDGDGRGQNDQDNREGRGSRRRRGRGQRIKRSAIDVVV